MCYTTTHPRRSPFVAAARPQPVIRGSWCLGSAVVDANDRGLVREGEAGANRAPHRGAIAGEERRESVTTAVSSRSTVNAFAFGTAQNAPGVTAGLEMWHTEDGALGRDGRVDAEQRRGQAGAALELRQHQVSCVRM